MNDLAGKRLLILGGSLWKEAIKQFADDNGIVLVATGNNTNAGIFQIADEQYEVNSVDKEAMIKFIKDHDIDGVYMGGAEIVISAACQYLAELQMPCYCTIDQWNLLQNKSNFKDLCVENGLPVVPKFAIDNINEGLPEQAFPVITKPTDGCGSSGFSVCRNSHELSIGYEKAAKESTTGSVIVEKYVNNKGNVVFYTVCDGVIYFSGFSDKYPVRYQKQGSFVGGLFVYESRFTQEFRKRYEDKIQKMISSIGIKAGTFWIEVFHNGNDYFFNEVGYRYGGSASIYPTDYLFGINQVAADIYYALLGKSKIFGHRSMISPQAPRKKHYAVYPIHLLPGTIGKIEGVETLKEKPSIIAVLTTKNLGEIIEDTGSFGQTFALVHMVFDDLEELRDQIEYAHRCIIVEDINRKSMIHRMLDLNEADIIL